MKNENYSSIPLYLSHPSPFHSLSVTQLYNLNFLIHLSQHSTWPLVQNTKSKLSHITRVLPNLLLWDYHTEMMCMYILVSICGKLCTCEFTDLPKHACLCKWQACAVLTCRVASTVSTAAVLQRSYVCKSRALYSPRQRAVFGLIKPGESCLLHRMTTVAIQRHLRGIDGNYLNKVTSWKQQKKGRTEKLGIQK